MAALPPESTARYRFTYTVTGFHHTGQIRSTMSPASFGVFLTLLVDTLDPLMYASTIDSVEWAASGSNIFNAVITGAEGHGYGTGAGTPTEIPEYIDFLGRSTGGRRTRLTFFGIGVSAGDYRFQAGENADVDAAIAVLVGTGGSLLCVDGLTPVWKSYANTGFNSYWQKVVRP